MPELQTLARRHQVDLQLLGMAGGDAIDFEGQMRVPLAELRLAWESALDPAPARAEERVL
jgi:hypothetical protein